MKKGQASVEFLFAVGTILFIFMILLGFAFNKNIESSKASRLIDTKNDCNKIVGVIMAAFLGGNGTIIESNSKFDFSTYPLSRTVGVDEDYVTCSVPINQYSELNLNEGDIRVINDNNFITLQNV